MRRVALALVLAAAPAAALETQVLPKGTFLLDTSYVRSTLDKQWNGSREGVPLIDELPRYEPGGGLQGVLRARPVATFHVAMIQLLYGVTDRLSAGLYVPVVVQTNVDVNMRWTPGDYQPQLGRSYSEDDFWAWAASMGQPRPPARWTGNRFTLSDVVLGGRYLLPEFAWMKAWGLRWAALASVALPTGSNFDPEEVVSAGTNLWELHAAGDAELHLSGDKLFAVDEYGVARASVGADVFGAWHRPRVYKAGTGAKNPLLNNIAPYVGETYVVDGGDWLGVTVSLDVAPLLGPVRSTRVSGYDLERAKALPPLLSFTLGYTFISTGQTDWRSQSPLWDWEREKLWGPGDKHIFRAMLIVSLLRLGVPLQLYLGYRAQDLVNGRYTRPANVFTAGARTLLKFW